MHVKFVSATNSIITDESGTQFTPEEFIVYIARVSNPSNQLNRETSEKLLRYLIKHKHWSPFEFVDMTVEITTRRSIAAQILRHKSFSFQEFSMRYSTALGIEDLELRKQAATNRQSSIAAWDGDDSLREAVMSHMKHSMKLYTELIEAGVAREVARDILPLAAETKMYMKGSIRSWIHYLELRTKEDTQKEHRDIANAINDVFTERFPMINRALTEQ